MKAVAYEAFLPHVLPMVPNCFEDQAVLAIRNACIDFCMATQVLQVDIDPISVTAGQNTYEVEVPTGYALVQVMELYYLRRKIERKSELELQKLYTMDWQTLPGTPRVFTQFNMEEIVLALNPSETVSSAVTGRLAIRPIRASKTVDGTLYEHHLDAIVAGALSRLKMTPDQPYSDYQGAAVMAGVFKGACASARSFVNGGMNHAPMRVRYNRIW